MCGLKYKCAVNCGAAPQWHTTDRGSPAAGGGGYEPRCGGAGVLIDPGFGVSMRYVCTCASIRARTPAAPLLYAMPEIDLYPYQAAELLGVDVATIRRWAERGYLIASKTSTGGHRWFKLNDVLALKARRDGGETTRAGARGGCAAKTGFHADVSFEPLTGLTTAS